MNLPQGMQGILGRAASFAKQSFWRILPGADRAAFELRPYELTLEFTNLCNANCVFCPYEQQTRPHETMPEAIFRKAVDEYVAMGGGSVGLTPLVGDALIDRAFLDRVRYLRSFPQIDRITLTTNGILLDRHGIDRVLDAGLSRINISTSGFDAGMYRRVYRNPGYAKMRRNVEEIFAQNARRSDPVPLYLCMRGDRPWEEVRAYPDFQTVLAYEPDVEYVTTFSRSGGLVQELPEGMVLEDEVRRPKTKPCFQTYLGLVVRSDGKVQICACEASVNAPSLVVGDLRSETLGEIWRGERLAALRRSFVDGTLNDNCSRCDSSYYPAGFDSRWQRRRARLIRRRLRGEVVRHEAPLKQRWLTE